MIRKHLWGTGSRILSYSLDAPASWVILSPFSLCCLPARTFSTQRRLPQVFVVSTGESNGPTGGKKAHQVLQKLSPCSDPSNRFPCTQWICPDLPMPNPTFLIKVTQPIYKRFIPAPAGLHTLKLRLRHHTHSVGRRIDDKLFRRRKAILVLVKRQRVSQQLEVFITSGIRRGFAVRSTALECDSEERESGDCPVGAVLGDLGWWGGSEEIV